MKIGYLVLLAAFFISCGSNSVSSGRQLKTLNANEITYAEIQINSGKYDAVKLTAHQIAKLAKWVNTTKNAQMYKAGPVYWINMKGKNKTFSYKLCGRLLGENDLYIELSDTAYFPNIYQQGEKHASLFR
jgi:hypothetical protein